MTGPFTWIRRARRLTAVGIGCGAAAVVGAGCQSVDTPPIPIARPETAAYPGQTANAPATRAGGTPAFAARRDRETTATAAVTSNQVRPAGDTVVGRADATVVAGKPTAPQGPPETDIDLGVALQLAGVDNPTINLARERVREALADQLAARALLLPSVNVGGNFYLHRGVLQASGGQIRDVDRQSLYLGTGARAVGTGTVAVPGVWLFAHLGDAVYEPLAARQRVAASRSDALAVQNLILRDVATAYLRLVGAEALVDVLRRGEADVAEVVRLTGVYADKGQGRRADADRAAANAELVRRQVREAEEETAVAAARLCRLLNLDPSVRLRTPGGAVQPFRLVPEDTDTEPLVAGAVRSRPELAARAAEILEAQTRVRQERVRPWVPLVSAGYSGGAFGGGSNLAPSDFGLLRGRSNFDVAAVWTVGNLGVGNRARVRRADAEVGQAVAEYDLAVNQVRREVAESQAGARAAARQIETATAALAVAEEGFRLEAERIRQGQGRPIETLDSFRQLLDSRQELVRAVVAFDVAQFRLFAAVGSNPLAASAGAVAPAPHTNP
jgi:outer membrane protein TolC